MIKKRKRIYDKSSLSSWSEACKSNWEENFSFEALQLGRKLYFKGKVKNLEVKNETLLVKGDHEGISFQSIVDKKEPTWEVSSSNKNNTAGNALAVAGLYELDELIEAQNREINFYKQKNLDKSTEENSTLSKTNISVAKKPKTFPKTLLLKFKTTGNSLVFTISWQRTKTLDRIKELDNAAPQTEQEREDLLRLIYLSKKAGFVWENSRFVKNDTESFTAFINNELYIWMQRFKVELSKTVESIKKGVQELQIDFEVVDPTESDFKENAQGIKIKYNFKLGDEIIQTKNFAKFSNNKTALIKDHGFVKLSNKAKQRLKRTEGIQKFYKDGIIPFYCLLSLFSKEERQRLSFSNRSKIWLAKIENFNSSKSESTFDWGNLDFLRTYQRQGVLWLKNWIKHSIHPLIADEMGLGKTLQVLSYLNLPTKKKFYRDVVVCPKSVVGSWQKEAARFFPDLTVKIFKADSEKELKTKPKCPELWIASYNQLRINVSSLKDKKFRNVILDEAQTIKNAQSKTSQACFLLGQQSDYRVALTGTPIENHRSDLWSIFQFLMPGLLGDKKYFEREFLYDSEKLIAQVSPFILRRTKEEVAKELPDKEEIIVFCPLTDTQKDLYKKYIKDYNSKDMQWGRVVTLLLRLRQICCDPELLHEHKNRDILESGKVEWLKDKLEECLENGRKIVLFSQFRSWLERLLPVVKKVYSNTFMLTGVTKKNRAGLIEKFQKTDSAAFLISLKAGGTGITLNTADTVFLLDPWWNPAIEQQAIDRLHRIGQKKQVSVYRLIAQDSVEEKVYNMQKQKWIDFKSIIKPSSPLEHRKNVKTMLNLIDFEDQVS